MLLSGIILIVFSYFVLNNLININDSKQFSGIDKVECDESMCTDTSQIGISD
jgi:hypothetical protein